MKYETIYNDYTIICSSGVYKIKGFKTEYETLRQAKEAIDFIMDEAMYQQ